jgi:hypothetical protein
MRVRFGDRYIERPARELFVEALLVPFVALLAAERGWWRRTTRAATLVSACVIGASITGCSEWMRGAADLAQASHGITWPGAFLVVGVCASLAWVLGKLFRS